MFNYVKNSLSKLIKSRLIVLVVLFALRAGILIQRLYTMQIINGEKYLTDFTMQIKKETTDEDLMRIDAGFTSDLREKDIFLSDG